MTIDLPAIQAGTILIAVATFFGALVGSVAQFVVRMREKRERRRNLRRALKSEMEVMPEFVHADLSMIFDIGATALLPSTNIYQSNIQEIGSLEEDEVIKIVEFYTSLVTIQQFIRDREYFEEGIWEPSSVLEKFSEDLEHLKESAIREIDNNL